jgi:hypothetical protein
MALNLFLIGLQVFNFKSTYRVLHSARAAFLVSFGLIIILLIAPVVYSSLIISLIKANYPDKEVPPYKMKWIKALFVVQLLASLLDALLFGILIWNYERAAHSYHPYRIRLVMGMLLFLFLLPANLWAAFTGLRLSKRINGNYRNELLGSFDKVDE